MLREHVHKELADIYDEFDRHSRITDSDYSIDADYPNFQGYTLLKCRDFDGFVRHISNFVKNRPVDFRVNGSPVDYYQIDKLPRRRNNLVTFALTPLQEKTMKKKKSKNKKEEEIMDENQYKFADTKHARDQNPRLNSSNAHKRSAFEESALGFEDRLKETLSEEISFTEPDILFTQSSHAIEPKPEEEDDLTKLEELKEDLNKQIKKYISIRESSNSDYIITATENLIESCADRIREIDEIINVRTS